MSWSQKSGRGLLVCLALAVPSWIIGKRFPVIGGVVIVTLLGMGIGMVWSDKGQAVAGIRFTSKVVLQFVVVLFGSGMNPGVVVKTGSQLLPIVVCTIGIALLLTWLFCRLLCTPGNTAILAGADSSICGGSAVAATVPVISTDDDEVARTISVIFFSNVFAAIFFPMSGRALSSDTTNGESFGLLAGIAINDTSSVTTAASAWDSMWQFGSQTPDKAVTVKLTRTSAIIPIALVLSLLRARAAGNEAGDFSFCRAFLMLTLYSILMTPTTTVALQAGFLASALRLLRELFKFCIIMAMVAIDLNSNLVKLTKSGGKPLLLDAMCWGGITAVSLFLQKFMF